MLSRFWAASLIALTLSPFTAPFSTCDAAMLFHRGPVTRTRLCGDRSDASSDLPLDTAAAAQCFHAPASAPSRPTVVAHASALDLATLVRAAGRVKFQAVLQIGRPVPSASHRDQWTGTGDARGPSPLRARPNVLRV